MGLLFCWPVARIFGIISGRKRFLTNILRENRQVYCLWSLMEVFPPRCGVPSLEKVERRRKALGGGLAKRSQMGRRIFICNETNRCVYIFLFL